MATKSLFVIVFLRVFAGFATSDIITNITYNPCSLLYRIFAIMKQETTSNIGIIINMRNRSLDFVGCSFSYFLHADNLSLRISFFLCLMIKNDRIRPNPIPKGRNEKLGSLYNPTVLGNIISPTMNNPTKVVIAIDAPTKGNPMS